MALRRDVDFTKQEPHYSIALPIHDRAAETVRQVTQSGPFTIERIIPTILGAAEQWPEVREYVINGFMDRGVLPSNYMINAETK
ncbi:MAG: hypothetical protein WCE81_05560 [Halobacteriota archaeon]